MPEFIYYPNSFILPYAFVLAIIAILYLLFSTKSLWVRTSCITVLLVLVIQGIVGFGGEAILKAIFGNKIISVFEGTVNPPDADPILVKKYLFICNLYAMISIWFTPIALIGTTVFLIINQLYTRAKLRMLIVITLGLFVLSLFIESSGTAFGVFGKL